MFLHVSEGQCAASITIILTVDHQDGVICRRLGACEGKSQCLTGVPWAHPSRGESLLLCAPSSLSVQHADLNCCPAEPAAVMG